MSGPAIQAAGLGPRQLKKASEALRALRAEQDKSDVINEDGLHMTRVIFHLDGRESQSNPEAARLYRGLVERWRAVPLTSKNLKAFLAEVEDATAQAQVARPCIDRRLSTRGAVQA